MNDLRLLLQVDKSKKVISLEFKQITSLDPLLPILSKFQSLESLSLHGNRLKNLPLNLGSLQCLAQLDLTNNLFGDIDEIIPSLKTLPSLTHLLYTFRSRQQEQYLRSQLSNLQRINKKPLNLKNGNSSPSKRNTQTIKLTEKDLTDVAGIYDQVREVYRNSKYFVDKQLSEDFQKHVEAIMSDLKEKINSGVSQVFIDNSVICCKYSLLDMSFVKIINYFYHFDKKIAVVLEKIHDFQADLFHSSSKIIATQNQKFKVQINSVKVKKQELYLKQIKRMKLSQAEMQKQIEEIQSKNKQIIERMMRIGRSDILETALGRSMGKSRVQKTVNPSSPFSYRKAGKSPLKYPPTHKNVSQMVTVPTNNAQKSLTLHQLKEMICEIMISKQKNNQLCKQTGHIMETTEAHMYTYLNQKYGLKNITIDWALNIVNGIRKYGLEDAEVALFGKILRNQIDESFFNILRRNRLLLKQEIIKFKSKNANDQFNDENLISIHQAQQILLNAHVKRDSISEILGKIRDSYLINNCLTAESLQKIFMLFLLKSHEIKLSMIREAFKAADSDEDGIISTEQLHIVVDKAKKGLNYEQINNQVDPYGTSVITFSHFCECVFYHPELRHFFQVGETTN